MRIYAIVQARMSSTRLPGKVLRNLVGVPMLGILFDRLKQSRALDGIILATSDQPSDDAVADLATDHRINVVRGPLEDVAHRFLLALEQYPCDGFVRICADCPLLDPTIVDQAVELFREENIDLVTNARYRSFPRGQTVEVIRTSSFKSAFYHKTSAKDREHLTRPLYDPSLGFSVIDLIDHEQHSDVRLVVDTYEDWSRLETLMSLMDRPHLEYGHRELRQLLAEV